MELVPMENKEGSSRPSTPISSISDEHQNVSDQPLLPVVDQYNEAAIAIDRQPSDDGGGMSTSSGISLKTQKTAESTDGIDVLGEAPQSGDFIHWKVHWIGRIVSNLYFKRAIIGLILLDSALMGLATFDVVTTNERLVVIFSTINTAFLCIFTVELILRLIHLRFNLLSNEWLFFDLIVISCSWLFSMLLVVRAFRVIRTLRLATRLKALRTMALALQEVTPKITAVAFIVALSFYIFSILFTDLYKDLYQNGYTEHDYFSRIDITAFTLFQIMTLDQWATITKEVQQAHPYSWLLFIPFVIISSFFVLNLTVAVLYEAMILVQQRESDPIPPDRGLVGSFATTSNNKPSDSLSRLEEKVDSLTSVVELLLRQQMQLQSSVSEMSPSTFF